MSLDLGIKNLAVIADLHLHDNHRGRHKNYMKVCFDFMNLIEEFVDEDKPDAIVFLGDIIGVTKEKVIRNRGILLEICRWFERLNIKTKNRVFVVRGNHDFGQNSEFDFLHGLGYFKTSNEFKYFDMLNEEGAVLTRFHLVDYGKEKESIEFCYDIGASNVVFAHNDFQIEGQTTWYYSKNGMELSKMSNWEGCELVVSGHIHNPSPWSTETTINDKTINLLYLGNGTRPTWDRNIYTWCWFGKFAYDKEFNSINSDTIKVELPKVDEVFYSDSYVEDLSDEEIAESVRREDLHSIVKDLIEYRIADGDPLKMIDVMPNTNPRSVKIAKDYIIKAYEERGVLKG